MKHIPQIFKMIGKNLFKNRLKIDFFGFIYERKIDKKDIIYETLA